ncbi:iron complex transport system permease protein [Georgenia satyanarayanai]|uniref:Iron complex transport system permease protein n=1 Tax=Georgenia satyanarayanai TaxID=860221 RepID=A0A2Y9A2E4_9MICO|nr:iron chelate uptake ABC transporter family permease subunit [Georgenia satyanarayanai]PYG01567.1 iron complex transport system permease protein [Georgenia satyanarayanai]SSA36367.1 iron complex transport system permease protein [Georgenia satyanarayanai]
MTTTLAPVPAHEVLRTVRHARRRRTLTVTLLLTTAVLGLAWLSLVWGGHTAETLDYLAGLFGGGEGGGEFTIGRLRLPRVVLGVLVGVALGIAGGIFQSVLGNPLASPDILGVSGGASLAAAFAILALGLSGAVVGLAAFLGATAVAAAIYLLAWRDGVTGFRFVLIGVAAAFVVNGAIGYLLTRGEVNDVRSALVWMVGSIGTPRWGDVTVLAVVVAALTPLVVAVARQLRALGLGDEAAGGLGVRVERTRLLALALAVALTASATALAGPVAFVAFVSAPIARRLLPTGGTVLGQAALVGAVVVLAAEIVAQHLIPSLEVPVGIVTGAVGAAYLLWLLATADRRAGTP